MKPNFLNKTVFIAVLLLAIPDFSNSQSTVRSADSNVVIRQKSGNSQVEERNVRSHLEFLAGDAMQGRGSGTQFELLAGLYIASQLQQFGIEPAGETDASGKKTFIQTVNIARNSFAESPKLNYAANNSTVSLEHGKDMIVLRMNAARISGGMQKLNTDGKPKSGAVVLIELREGEDSQNLMQKLQAVSMTDAAAVIVEETPQWRAQWSNLAARRLSFTTISNDAGKPFGMIIVGKDAVSELAKLADGAQIEIKGQLSAPQTQQTWNAVGKLTGSDSRRAPEVILLSAHLDHLGVRPNAPGDDKIYNGADDDASGCVAVLELARALAQQRKRPKRTVYFAFFGSEEAGGYGSQYFVNNLSFPKDNLAANLQFEMLGRPDAKVAAGELWLTGYERSNLGSELAKQGAKLVADPHPEQNFFQRSDNYTLARQGVVAHTVSSFGLHTDYHKPGDEIKTIDFDFMTRAINSMIKPVRWLVNSNFKPIWFEGKKP